MHLSDYRLERIKTTDYCAKVIIYNQMSKKFVEYMQIFFFILGVFVKFVHRGVLFAYQEVS